MKSLALAVFLLPTQALALPNPCTPKSTSLCTPNNAQKKKIMVLIEAGVAAHAAWMETNDKYLKTLTAGKDDEETRAALLALLTKN